MVGTVVTTYLTIASIFFLYLASILLRYSGLISMAAKLKAEFFRPALWHSITVEVRMGTMSAMQVEEHWHDARVASLSSAFSGKEPVMDCLRRRGLGGAIGSFPDDAVLPVTRGPTPP